MFHVTHSGKQVLNSGFGYLYGENYVGICLCLKSTNGESVVSCGFDGFDNTGYQCLIAAEFLGFDFCWSYEFVYVFLCLFHV